MTDSTVIDTLIQTIKHPILSDLSGGIGWTCFAYGLSGVFLHWLLKLSDGMTTAQKENAVFVMSKWVLQQKVYLVITFVSGMLAIFLTQQYWPPTTIAKSIIMGFVSGSAIYNIWSIVNSPDTWKGFFEKFIPSKKNE